MRLQVKGPRRDGSQPSRPVSAYGITSGDLKLAGRDLPVCVVIGGHPAVMLAAAAKMGMDQDEYELAGALLDAPLDICRAKTVDVDVPAYAEIVIEGFLRANCREPEGPFGEYTGYALEPVDSKRDGK